MPLTKSSRHGLGQVMIAYASLLHGSWAVISLVDPAAYNSTALSGVVSVFGSITPLILLTTAGLAAVGLGAPDNAFGRLFLMLPQQGILMISAYTAGACVWNGAYADGVIRPWPFILADQMPVLLGAICYSLAVVLNGMPSRIPG